MMEVVLTRLRDFSCKAATFGDCNPAGAVARPDPRTRDCCPAEGGRTGDYTAVRGSPFRLDIESALAWLRRELMEMRSQDQALIRQLMDLHTGIQELKQELSEEEEEPEEEEEEPEEEVGWDSESEAGGSSEFSSSGEVSFASCLSTRMTPPLLGSLPRRLFSRRSSVP